MQGDLLALLVALKFNVVVYAYSPVSLHFIVLLLIKALLKYLLDVVKYLENVVTQHGIGKLQLKTTNVGTI